MSCSKCGCSPCKCQSCEPGVLNQPRIFNPQVSGGLFQNGTYQSPIIDGGTASGQAIIGATIDCTTQVCHQPTGTCNATIASTAFVCVAIQEAISSLNPTFCAAVEGCVSNNPAAFCLVVESCINNVNNIINTTQAFGALARATDLQYGVVRYATLTELQNAVCTLAIDPCTLGQFWSAGGPNPLWTAFEFAANLAVTGGGSFCTAVFACGVQDASTLCADVAACGFAPLNSPIFTGTPQAPTQASGNSTTAIATTEFVMNAIADAISVTNPAFCPAVIACGGGGGGGSGGTGVVAQGVLNISWSGCWGILNVVSLVGCTIGPFLPFPNCADGVTITLNTAQPNANYQVVFSESGNTVGPQLDASATFGTEQLAGSFQIFGGVGPAPGGQYFLHFTVLAADGSIPCSLIQATFPAAGVALPGGVRLAADNCSSYTAQEIINQSGLQGVTFAAGSMDFSTAVQAFMRGCTALGFAVTFNAPQPDVNYSVVFGGFDFLDFANYHGLQAITKTVNGFTIDRPGLGPGFAGGNFDFACVR